MDNNINKLNEIMEVKEHTLNSKINRKEKEINESMKDFNNYNSISQNNAYTIKRNIERLLSNLQEIETLYTIKNEIEEIKDIIKAD